MHCFNKPIRIYYLDSEDMSYFSEYTFLRAILGKKKKRKRKTGKTAVLAAGRKMNDSFKSNKYICLNPCASLSNKLSL